MIVADRELGDMTRNLEDLAENARGITVTVETLQAANGGSSHEHDVLKESLAKVAPHEFLDEGEQPHYLFLGTTADIDQSSGVREDVGIDTLGGKNICSLITDRRTLIIGPTSTGVKDITIPHASVQAVQANSALFGMKSNYRLETPGANYKISASLTVKIVPNNDPRKVKQELQDAVEYIRNWTEPSGDQNDSAGDESSSVNKLRELKELNKEGILTDEEFQQKKADILDDY